MSSARTGKRRTKAPRDGFLYVISHPAYPDSAKCGRSSDPYRRISAANTWSPHSNYRLEGAVHFTYVAAAEAALHHLLKESRMRGEWFRINAEKAVHIIRGLARRETTRLPFLKKQRTKRKC